MTLRSQAEPLGELTKGQVLVVACGTTYFGIPTEIVRGIVRPEQEGFGIAEDHPPADLGARFGFIGSSVTPESRVILCGVRKVQEAFGVDQVLGLAKSDGLNIRPLPPHFTGAERRWFQGLFMFQDTVALLVNSTWLLDEQRRAPGTAA